jgi:hypothetical protein
MHVHTCIRHFSTFALQAAYTAQILLQSVMLGPCVRMLSHDPCAVTILSGKCG